MIYVVYLTFTLIILWLVYRQWQYMTVFHPKLFRSQELYDDHYTFLSVIAEDGIELEGCVYEPKEPSSTLVYFGGRGQDSVGLLPKLAQNCPQKRIVTFNYRGYGKSQGKPSEERLLKDSVEVLQKIKKCFGEVDVLGYSLGSSVASFAASKEGVQRLILVGAFCSLASLTKERFGFVIPFVRYKFDTCLYLQKVMAPVALFCSRFDQTVPFRESKKLQNAVVNMEICKELEGFDHVSLLWSEEVRHVLCHS